MYEQASKRQLDVKAVHDLKRLLVKIVADPTLSRVLSRNLDETKSLSPAVDTSTTRASAKFPRKLGKRLQLLVSLYDITNGNADLVGTMIHGNSIHSLDDVAESFCESLDGHLKGQPGDATLVKQRLFELCPTAMLYGLINSGKIPVPHSIKMEVSSVLSTVRSTFDISKMSIRKVLESQAFTDQVPKHKQHIVKEFLKVMQRLQALVALPEDIAYMLKASFISAEMVANTPPAAFDTAMEAFGLRLDVSKRIHHQAVIIHMRNEQAWTSLLQSRTRSGIHSIDGSSLAAVTPTKLKPRIKPSQFHAERTLDSITSIVVAASSDSPQTIDFESLFEDTDEVSCDDCTSVTSLSAYFVDLLRMLKNCFVDTAKTVSLLDLLLKRRSDLANLELSCSNTNTLLPYIDLVNEILESFVAFVGVATANEDVVLDAFNAEQFDTSDDQIAQPHNIRTDIYQTSILPQVFPPNVFPFNQGVDSVRSYLGVLGTSRYDLMRTLRSEQRLASRNKITVEDIQLTLVTKAADRAIAAEYLGFLPADYIAITKQSFWPIELVRLQTGNASLTNDGYLTQIGLLPVASYWGYKDPQNPQNADALMRDTLNGDGIPFIKLQLLPRADVLFPDLVKILKTRAVAGSMVIISKSSEAIDFTKADPSFHLDDMRLYHASGSPLATTPLTTDDCDLLALFVRLWRKLGWSITETDEAQAIVSPNPNPGPGMNIDGDAFEDLAAIKQICLITGIDVLKLLPLWGDISTNGDESLYSSVFLKRRITGRDPVFLPDATGHVLTKQDTFQAHMPVVLAALDLTPQDFAAIKSSQTPNNPNDSLGVLSLGNLSLFYRIGLIAKILGITPAQYATFAMIFREGPSSPLVNPRQTLSILEKWNRLTGSGWTLPQLAFVLNGVSAPQDQNVPSEDNILKTTATIIDEVQKLRNTYPPYSPSPERATKDEVTKISSLIFGYIVAQTLAQFIEGTLQVKTQVSVTPSSLGAINVPPYLAGKIDFGKSGSSTLVLTGVLTPTEMADALSSSSDQGWKDAVQNVDALSKKPYETFLSPVFSSLGIDARAREVLLNVDQTKPTARGKNFVRQPLRQEATATDQRIFYLDSILPILLDQLEQQIILDSVKIDFPAVDALLLQTLLCNYIRMPLGDNTTVTSMSSIQNLVHGQVIAATGFSGYLTPRSTDTYRFIAPDPGNKISPVLYINDVLVSFPDPAKSGQLISAEIRLVKGQYYRLIYGGDLSLVQLRPPQMPAALIIPEILLNQGTLDGMVLVYTALARAAKTIAAFKLSSGEVRYLHDQGLHSEKLDLTAMTLVDLDSFQVYSALRDTLPSNEETVPLLDLFNWAAQAENQSEDHQTDLVKKIVALTNVEEARIKDYLAARYLGLSGDSIISLFKDQLEIGTLVKVMAFVTGSGLSTAPLESLFTWAEPETVVDPLRAFDDAATLRQLMRGITPQDQSSTALTNANNQLRNNQRRALVSYLLQHPYVKGLKLQDADSLFEFLLIDVQMGACLQTSRMKQAVSTVQLYVQRCLLNLEDENGVSSGVIDSKRWAWMQRYRLWEANRLVFLYPENWIDPSLRDDKSELFVTLESAIMQGNLDESSLSDAVKAYIYAANEIGDLEILAYQWDNTNDHQGYFHIFARTKTSPYKYFYRHTDTLNAFNFWYPWQKIDLDIPSYETDADGNMLLTAGTYLVPAVWKSRLYLFIPQTILKTKPSNTPIGDTSFGNLRDKTVNETAKQVSRYWEIRIAWSEYLSGRWAPKQISQAALRVEALTDKDLSSVPTSEHQPDPVQGKLFPDISSFRFWVRARSSTTTPTNSAFDNILVIDAERWIASTDNTVAVNVPLGRFEMRGPQLVEAKAEDIPSDYQTLFTTTLPSEFGKLHMDRDQGVKPFALSGSMYHGGTSLPPVLSVIDTPDIPTNVKRTITWTLSYDDSYNNTPTGLVAELTSPIAQGSQTYFAIPDQYLGDQTVFNWTIFYHSISPLLMEAATASIGLEGIYETIAKYVPSAMFDGAFGKFRNGSAYGELATPYSIYNWELGFHVVSLLMERLLATQQFDLAIKVARFVFDPTVPGTELTRCWLFPPFRDTDTVASGSLDTIMKSLHPSSGGDTGINVAIAEWLRNPFSPHSVARARPVAYMKRIVRKYIEVLIAYGDYYFRQNSLETIPFAIQLYVEASHIFGPPQQKIPKIGDIKVQTYKQLSDELDDFSNAAVDMELDFPFYSPPQARGFQTAPKFSTSLIGFPTTEYFCIPVNPQISALRDLIDNRLYKIRNCQDIDGNFQRLALFDPPIDPGMLVRAIASGLSPSAVLNDLDSPMPNYRFYYLLQKAIELCSELKQLQGSLLAVKEKRDGEAISNLKCRHDTVIQQSVLDLKKLQRKEISKAIEQLQEARRGPVLRLSYYQLLTGEGLKAVGEDEDFTEIQQQIETPTDDVLKMTSNERLEMLKADVASDLNQQAAALETTASGLLILPGLSFNIEPLGVGTTVKADAGNIAQYMLCVSTYMKSQSQLATDEGSQSSRKAQLIRQLQDRRLQANIAGREIKSIDKQVAIETSRADSAERDIAMQEQQIADAKEVENFLRSKYTNEQLYIWMDNSVRDLFYNTYTLAIDLAKKAEKAFRFEQGTDDTSFIQQSGYWDSGRDGLLSAENLYLALKRLETAYLDAKSSDFEITKHVSLRQINPAALLTLRESGTADFELAEVLYDFDYPGNYNRRIKSVSVSIPCIVGPYTSTNCTLSLLQHKYRISTSTKDGYAEQDDDIARFRTDRIPITSIAISSGQQDAGVFQLNFSGERYLPFEGAGAISKWHMEFSSVFPQFDYNSISDVIIHLRYTASNGGLAFRQAATNAVMGYTQSVDKLGTDQGLFALFDLKNDYSNEWFTFATAPPVATNRTMLLKDMMDRMPFYTKGRTITVKDISVHVGMDAPSASKAMLSVNTPDLISLDLEKGQSQTGIQTFAKHATKAPVTDWQLTLKSDDGAKLVLNRGFLLIRYTLT